RGDGDDVDVLVLDHLADVLHVLRRVALDLLDVLHGRADHGLIDVADGGDDAALAVLLVRVALDVAHALAADADAGDAGLGGGSGWVGGLGGQVGRGGAGRGGEGGRGGEEGRFGEEVPAVDAVHAARLHGEGGKKRSA